MMLVDMYPYLPNAPVHSDSHQFSANFHIILAKISIYPSFFNYP